MKTTNESRETKFSRRDLLKSAGALGITAAGAAALVPPVASEAGEQQAQGNTLRAVQALTAQQFATLTAITARIFPTDASGPGAIEAHAANYIDRALTSHYSEQKDNYIANLSALDAYSKATYQAGFAELTPDNQDAVLTAMEGKKVDNSFGFVPNAAAFFSVVLEHTQEGMFSDPYYGGNANFIGWDLLDFAGIKLSYSAAEQELDHPISKAHVSAYRFSMFERME